MTIFKRIYVLALAVAVVMPAMAQFKIGPRVGINVNSLHFNKEIFQDDNRTGFNAGIQAEFTIPMVGLGFDASVMYVKRNAAYMSSLQGQSNPEVKLHSDYIEIPVNLKYKIGLPVVGSIITPYIFTGPSFAFLTSKKIVNDMQNKKCDVAWNFGLGLEFIKHLQIGASYGLGMTKALQTIHATGDNAGIEGKNRYWTVTAAWLF
ncbi:MAG: porin family protein [Muribaculaceae bacterium]|nr:porin family protein [Muribaculaceae bacterium]